MKGTANLFVSAPSVACAALGVWAPRRPRHCHIPFTSNLNARQVFLPGRAVARAQMPRMSSFAVKAD